MEWMRGTSVEMVWRASATAPAPQSLGASALPVPSKMQSGNLAELVHARPGFGLSLILEGHHSRILKKRPALRERNQRQAQGVSFTYKAVNVAQAVLTELPGACADDQGIIHPFGSCCTQAQVAHLLPCCLTVSQQPPWYSQWRLPPTLTAEASDTLRRPFA